MNKLLTSVTMVQNVAATVQSVAQLVRWRPSEPCQKIRAASSNCQVSHLHGGCSVNLKLLVLYPHMLRPLLYSNI
jgi:hypothetical protein